MKILVTGGAGFIGSKLVYELCQLGHEVVTIDNMNDYYDVKLKKARLEEFCSQAKFLKLDLCDKHNIDALFHIHKFDKVINLAAQAGVRYSIDHPYEYINSNVIGFLNILEACQHHNVKHLIYASSSSVYGNTSTQPFTENQRTDSPVSLYAATKKSNELFAHTYSKLYNLPTTGLRFFTVYGPYGRPDMAPILFASAIAKGEEIKVYNNGDMYRDFTYIDDIVNGIIAIVNGEQKYNDENIPYGIYNIGCGHKENLMHFIELIEKALDKQANKTFLPMQPGDVQTTFASTLQLEQDFGYKTKTTIDEGVPKFIEWFKQYYKEIN